ncbi:MAG: hypothetical protein GTN40_01695 [Candidatus Aenigmarchaeota archaeon]|nr:hypothetical protein [Candidatus Aenigmarchaeota archaeon]
MAKEKNQVYTPHAMTHMSDEDVDRILLGFMPMKLTKIYERFGVRKSSSKKTKNRIRNRLNALTDNGLIYASGRGYRSLKYHKKDEYQEST